MMTMMDTSAMETNSMLGCLQCGFELYKPISSLQVSTIGLYDDARFPGRCIVSLNSHYEDMIEVPESTLNAFIRDIRQAMKAIQEVTGCSRVNLAILGNAVPHVHAHLIPRYPDAEANPNQSPWNDPRPKDVLQESVSQKIIEDIANTL